MVTNQEELDRLMSNMDEHQIRNMLSVLNLYVTERSLAEIKIRIESVDMDWTFEWKMRWVMEFKKYVEEHLKD